MYLVFEILLTLSAAFLYLTNTQWDPFHETVVGISLLVVVVVHVFVSIRQNAEMKEAARRRALAGMSSRRGNYSDPIGKIIVVALLYAVGVYAIASGLAFAGSKIPAVYGMFYDRGYLDFKSQVQLYVDAGNEDQAIEKIETRLDENPGAPEYQKDELIEWKYNLLIDLGKQAETPDEKTVLWQKAVDWGKENGLNTGEAEALIASLIPPEVVIATAIPPTPTPGPKQFIGNASFKTVTKDGYTLSMTVKVTDANGAFVDGLGPYDMRVVVMGPSGEVFVDPASVRVDAIKNLQVPVTVTIFFDNSKSMLEQKDGEPIPFDAAKQALIDLAGALRQIDKVNVVVFGHEIKEYNDLSPEEAIALAKTLKATGQSTRLYDAVALAKKTDGPQIILVLSDGGDTGSSISPQTAADALTQSGAIINGVALQSAKNDGSGLNSLIQLAGGETFLTERASQLSEIFLQVAQQTQSLYRVQVLLPTQDIQSVTLKIGDTVTVGPYVIR